MQTSQSNLVKLISLIFILCSMLISSTYSGQETSLLTRRKRYIVFPEGSSFSIALCMTVHTLTPDNIFTEGVNWGISYDLPNESKPELDPFLQLRRDQLLLEKHQKVNKNHIQSNYKYYVPSAAAYDKFDAKRKEQKFYYPLAGGREYRDTDHKHYLQRRYRRNLYNKIELIINAMGFDGRKCIFRALCEAAQRLMPRGKTLIEEMIRTVFALPIDRLFSFEPDDHHAYARAHSAGHEKRDCIALFPECSFSLIDMALGTYNSDPADRSGERLGEMLMASRLANGLLSPNARLTM